MVSEHLPSDDGKSNLIDLIKEGRPNGMYNKLCVVRHTCLIEYNLGAHKPKTIGGWAMSTDKPYLKLLHYRYLSLDLVLEKARRINLSNENKKVLIGITQATPELMKARWKEAWRAKIRVLP